MQSYSATITCSIVTTVAPHDLLNPKGHTFYNKIHIKCYFEKLQTHFLQDLLLTGFHIFPQAMVICWHLIEYVLLVLLEYVLYVLQPFLRL